jgi:ATP-dependent helicase HrpA
VNYSQIDPVLSRELFIRNALVEGEWQTRHAFFKANLKLREEVEELEHKSRRRDILVDDETLFAFYDMRIPQDVVSARHFDSWWKLTSREQPELLNFAKEMLIKEGASNVSKLDYPNVWQQGNLKLRLSYQFEPGNEADGVTVHVPLPLLNQVEENGFEWQIPGVRRELIIALIKSLPKPVRRNLVPAPNYADAFLGRVTPMELPLLESLEREFRRMTGITIDREAWQWDQVPDHLKITYRVVDENNRKLNEGRDLAALKLALKGKVQETLSLVADDGLEQSGLHIWSFGDLPDHFEQKRGNYSVKAWPALVDEKDSVAIRLFDSQHEQQKAMWRGQRRLLLLNIPSPIKYLHEKLPNKAKLGLYFNPYGKVLDLIDDCIACGVDKLIDEHGGPTWQEAGYSKLHDKVRAELNDTVVDIAKKVEQILTAVFNINKRLKGRVDMSMALALSDVKAQLGGLVYKGFVTQNGWKRLSDTLRYLTAMERRLEKMPIDPHSDRARMLKIEKIQQAWSTWYNKLPAVRREDEDVKDVRWMIEELRVSYFAQQLGTPYPVSEKRIQQAMDEIVI